MTTDEMRKNVLYLVKSLVIVARELDWKYDVDTIKEYRLSSGIHGKVVRKHIDGQRYGVIHVPWPRELGYGVVWLDWDVCEKGVPRISVKVYDIHPMNGGRSLWHGVYRNGQVEWDNQVKAHEWS